MEQVIFFSSVFVGAILRGKTPIKAVKIAADFVVESIKKTLNDIKAHWYGVKFEKIIPKLNMTVSEGCMFKISLNLFNVLGLKFI